MKEDANLNRSIMISYIYTWSELGLRLSLGFWRWNLRCEFEYFMDLLMQPETFLESGYFQVMPSSQSFYSWIVGSFVC